MTWWRWVGDLAYLMHFQALGFGMIFVSRCKWLFSTRQSWTCLKLFFDSGNTVQSRQPVNRLSTSMSISVMTCLRLHLEKNARNWQKCREVWSNDVLGYTRIIVKLIKQVSTSFEAYFLTQCPTPFGAEGSDKASSQLPGFYMPHRLWKFKRNWSLTLRKSFVHPTSRKGTLTEFVSLSLSAQESLLSKAFD